MRQFEYLFLKEEIPASFLQTAAIIYDLRAREDIRKSEHPETFHALQKSAIIDSVTGSNAIEGIVTGKERMHEILSQGERPATHDEKEILGYRNALDEIYSSWDQISLTEDFIKHLHERMMSDTSDEAGQYKRENNWIQSVDENGHATVRFVPVSANETPQAMQAVIQAYHAARQESEINGLLLTFCFILDFLCIHPFTDGNGRVSRLLTSYLLLREGFDIGKYISVDAKVKEFQYAYYDALNASSEKWHDNTNTYIPFMTFQLQILYRCYKELDQKFIAGTGKNMPKSKQVELILLNSFVPVSKEELSARLPDVSQVTIERVLGSLVKEGKIKKIGTYRDARYMRA